ncbi:hypothetical protein PSDVSF_00510 [Pseudodesulfovibrio sediminis]|uniref:Flagella basal body P-ring formation protein FlgA SAF domain-containing protein n=2 Tax=Pseudodesulfovibrio sediminis TaxID=2810563 RepID=A0ABN6ENJ2_9BACT|nr:hypothetical protein PSDVSF_00510 [Pseudodesulfovibrio sediminis]
MAWQAIVKSAACVQGPYVLLGEIAYPAGSMDDATWESLANIKLWKASTRAGRPVAVSRDKLRSILKYYLGDMVENLILPSQITVQTGGRVISGEELKSRVVAFLTPRAEDLGGDVEFKDFHLPRQIFFPNLYDTLSLSANDIVPGRNQVKIHGVTPDGKIVTSKAGTVFINVWKAIPVAAKPMNRFERVSPANVSFQRVNLAYRQNVWDGTGGPWRMARTLGRGQPFTLSHLEPIPLIEKGERVYLTFQGKRVKLTIKAVALGEAGMGQQVSVKNLQSNKTVLATVISDDTVVVR